MDCKAVNNAVTISWYQRQHKVFINFYFWLFWQSFIDAFFTWHKIDNNAIIIAAIIYFFRDAEAKKYVLVITATLISLLSLSENAFKNLYATRFSF